MPDDFTSNKMVNPVQFRPSKTAHFLPTKKPKRKRGPMMDYICINNIQLSNGVSVCLIPPPSTTYGPLTQQPGYNFAQPEAPAAAPLSYSPCSSLANSSIRRRCLCVKFLFWHGKNGQCEDISMCSEIYWPWYSIMDNVVLGYLQCLSTMQLHS